MPVKMTLVPAQSKPENVSKEAWDAIKKGGERVVNAASAMEAIRNSRGAYQIKGPKKEVFQGPKVEHMTNRELITMANSLGKTIRKQMSRTDLIRLVEAELEKQESLLVDDENTTTISGPPPRN